MSSLGTPKIPAVKRAMIREMRLIKDEIAQRDKAIPDLQRRLSDARGERLELITALDTLERHADDQGLGITPADLKPVVVNACNGPDDDDIDF